MKTKMIFMAVIAIAAMCLVSIAYADDRLPVTFDWLTGSSYIVGEPAPGNTDFGYSVATGTAWLHGSQEDFADGSALNQFVLITAGGYLNQPMRIEYSTAGGSGGMWAFGNTYELGNPVVLAFYGDAGTTYTANYLSDWHGGTPSDPRAGPSSFTPTTSGIIGLRINNSYGTGQTTITGAITSGYMTMSTGSGDPGGGDDGGGGGSGSAVPEPATVIGIISGLVMAALRRVKRNNK